MSEHKEFKMLPYLYWYANDWLGDPEVRRLPDNTKGFYVDLISHMHKCYPYGFCSLPNTKKFSKLQKQVNQNSNQEVNLVVEIQLHFSLKDQLKLAESIEHNLSQYLPQKQDIIDSYLMELVARGILRRSASGIIYSKRMVKDFKKRVVAYLNGSKGGNPGIKLGQTGKKIIQQEMNKKVISNDIENLDNQNVGGTGFPTADYISIISKSIGREGVRGRRIPAKIEIQQKIAPVFQMQGLYDKNFAELQATGYSKNLTEEGFLLWKKFVDWVIGNEYTDLFISKFIQPYDLQRLTADGFTESLWDPVIKKILGTGMKPEHNLYYRIPDFMKYIKPVKDGAAASDAKLQADDEYKFDPKKHQ